jgi:hypothetical protein
MFDDRLPRLQRALVCPCRAHIGRMDVESKVEFQLADARRALAAMNVRDQSAGLES